MQNIIIASIIIYLLLDHTWKNIMEFGISAPHYFKYKNGVTKNIARKALKDILPNDVIKKKKDRMERTF